MAAGTMRASVFKHRESIARSSVSSARPSVYGLALPLGLNLGDDFNLAKARADAAAAGSQASSYRSRRQSGNSQVSYSSRRSARSGRTGRRGRGRKAVKAGAENLEPEIIQVFDENGKDVTPKPLVSLRPTVLHEKLLQAPPDHFSPESERVSSLSRVGYCSSMGSITPETFDVEDGLQKDETDVNLAKRGSIVATQGGATSAPADRTPEQKRVTVVTAGVPPLQSEEGLEKMATVTLKETDTFVLLDLWGNSVSNAYSNLKQVLERNLHYTKLLQDKIGSDNYSDSAAQTLMSLQKSKESQLSAVPSQSEACQVNSWDISDSYTGKDQAESVNVPKLPGTITTATAGTVTEPDNSNIATMLVSAGYLEKPGSSNAAPYYSQVSNL
ncbi:hypothetical protein O6H91_03G016000 [Diphasiastrum complanatum]|uniref:Uncharacterized protein n=1 Tax=Diphasiastrum complanatum TaxID=34168 RepID=A0ACC2E3P7_DIPCM|nr:hypothetical protein O6H91_03G016000 [Diphasiastrum complanatum]